MHTLAASKKKFGIFVENLKTCVIIPIVNFFDKLSFCIYLNFKDDQKVVLES